jgi:N,N'-diacetyllegionaminate synthase
MSNAKPHLLIAEIGSVHDGSFGNACKLIEAAASCGADAVKFQTHIAEAETLASAPSPSYFSAEPRMDYFRRTGFSLDQWKALKQVCEKNDVLFLSSPFSLEAVDLLEQVGVSSYKIPSGEVTNLPLLERVAQTGKMAYLSSGMSSWKELDAAVEVLKRPGKLIVMQCSSAYPCPPEQVGLNVLAEMQKRYGVPVGFSDHTLGFAAPVAAATLGATVIEKHFTFSKQMYGSDAKHSMEPEEFKVLAQALREVWAMLANPVNKESAAAYGEMKKIFEKSIVLSQDLRAGTKLDRQHFAFKKPGTGICASRYKELIGRTLKSDTKKDHLLQEEDLK